MTKGTHEFVADPRNETIRISVNGRLVPRAEAMVSVFDSGFVLGDGVWEGLRLVDGGVPFLRAHMERLYEGAKAIFMDIGLAPGELAARLDIDLHLASDLLAAGCSEELALQILI